MIYGRARQLSANERHAKDVTAKMLRDAYPARDEIPPGLQALLDELERIEKRRSRTPSH